MDQNATTMYVMNVQFLYIMKILPFVYMCILLGITTFIRPKPTGVSQ